LVLLAVTMMIDSRVKGDSEAMKAELEGLSYVPRRFIIGGDLESQWDSVDSEDPGEGPEVRLKREAPHPSAGTAGVGLSFRSRAAAKERRQAI
jgi:hypothetical protein